MGNVYRFARAAPYAIFLGVVGLLWCLAGNRLILGTNDEGIYLDAAERILHGQRLYVDFFGYMSPGSFWMQALAFRVFGVSLAAGRVLVVGYVALECALIYWLVARFASRSAGIVTALLFLAFESADPSMLTAQHRWDSGAFALASIALCICARRSCLAASGFLMGCAALATPSVGLVALVTVIWLRSRAALYLLGLGTAGALAIAALWLRGSWTAFLSQLVWLSRNYSAANVMPYGSIIGGYRALFGGASVWELPIRFCIVLCLALPALLPVAAIAGGVVLWRREKIGELPYLLLCVIALVASTHPRSDIAHLEYVAALPYAVSGIVVYRCLAPHPRAWLAAAVGVWAAIFAWQAQFQARLQTLHTPVGDVRASAEEAKSVGALLFRVEPGQSLFVYPYKPLLYFLTQTENPARFPYLQPGLMTHRDADVVLSELQTRPPQWVLYMALDRPEFERVFPSAHGLDPHYPQLERWIQTHYFATTLPPLRGYFLLQRAGPAR